VIWLLAHRRISTKLLDAPYTETAVEGAHSLVYWPGVAPVKFAGQVEPYGPQGTFGRGLHRASGFVFSFDGDVAEKLLGIDAPVSVIAYYLAARNRQRKRTFIDVVFVGDATVRIPPLNDGMGDLIGVPFKVNIPYDETLEDHIVDEAE